MLFNVFNCIINPWLLVLHLSRAVYWLYSLIRSSVSLSTVSDPSVPFVCSFVLEHFEAVSINYFRLFIA